MTEQLPTELRDTSTSARLVYRTIEHEEPITFTELLERTGLSDAGLRYALDQLREADVVTQTTRSDDARYRPYHLK